MVVLLFFAFISGLVTIAAPCIWPLLPIILSSTATSGKAKALGVVLGIMTSFSVFTLTLSYIVRIIPFDPNILRFFAVAVITFLGLTLLIPKLSQILEGYVSRVSSKVGAPGQIQGSGFKSGFITGFSLGIVWSPCAGPILATIATLAATRAVSFQLVLVTLVYVLGVGIPLFIFALLGSVIFSRTRALSQYTGRVQQIFGVIMILTALAIFTNFDKTLQARLLDAFPSYTNFVNTLESNSAVKEQLKELKGTSQQEKVSSDDVPEYNLIGLTKWLNVEKPPTLADLKGKVVLVDFWTYTCINCIRTLPYITRWYDTYKDQGFVVIGVHAPEFEFEKNTANVEDAIKRFGIHYPVAQDNDFNTWRAYNNEYWPAHYVFDAKGQIRDTHFGEGKYEETEQLIRQLLKEAGKSVTQDTTNVQDTSPKVAQTPESYLGSSRIARFASPESLIGGVQSFTAPANLDLHTMAYSGKFDVQPEYVSTFAGSKLTLHFTGDQVYLVMSPKTPADKVKVLLDGKPVPASVAGDDVKDGMIKFDMERLYRLINLHEKPGDHILELQFGTDGTKAFAFTFG